MLDKISGRPGIWTQVCLLPVLEPLTIIRFLWVLNASIWIKHRRSIASHPSLPPNTHAHIHTPLCPSLWNSAFHLFTPSSTHLTNYLSLSRNLPIWWRQKFGLVFDNQAQFKIQAPFKLSHWKGHFLEPSPPILPPMTEKKITNILTLLNMCRWYLACICYHCLKNLKFHTLFQPGWSRVLLK